MSFPSEIWQLIASNLDTKDSLALQSVCRESMDIIKINSIDKKYMHNLTYETLDKLNLTNIKNYV